MCAGGKFFLRSTSVAQHNFFNKITGITSKMKPNLEI